MEDIQKEFKRFDLETWNEEEEDRLEGLSIAKLRGKGAPKKRRTADGKFLKCLSRHRKICEYLWQVLVLIKSGNSEQEEQEEKEVAAERLLNFVYRCTLPAFTALRYGARTSQEFGLETILVPCSLLMHSLPQSVQYITIVILKQSLLLLTWLQVKRFAMIEKSSHLASC